MRQCKALTTVTRVPGISTSNRLIVQRDRNDHPVVRSGRPSCRPDLRAPTLSRAAAVQDARGASPQSARRRPAEQQYQLSIANPIGIPPPARANAGKSDPAGNRRRLDADFSRR